VKTCSLLTTGPIQAIDVTDLVAAELRAARSDGLALASCPHTTAALLLMESDEELLSDLEGLCARFAEERGPFRHHKNDNPNGAAHLLSAGFGTQLLLPVSAGDLTLGSYQRIVFLELDGPRERRIELRLLASLDAEVA
jgi:secondary thiamine-phosphate synthase enzyme